MSEKIPVYYVMCPWWKMSEACCVILSALPLALALPWSYVDISLLLLRLQHLLHVLTTAQNVGDQEEKG